MAKKGSTSASTAPEVEVPFFGWSLAAHQFRLLAAERARGAGSLLIIAASRLQRQMMAEAWRKAGGAEKDALPVIDLERCSPSDIPRRCIATTGRPTQDRPRELLPLHLDWTDEPRHRPVPAEERHGEPISKDVSARFALKVYMPPLARRQMDILAWLHFYNARVLPTLGFQFEAVTSRLIHELLYDCTWQGDEDALAGYLEAATSSGGSPSQPTTIPLLKPDNDMAHFLPNYELRKGVREAATRVYDDASFPFHKLPELAVRIFRWRAQFGLAAALGPDNVVEPDGVDPCDLLAPDFQGDIDGQWSAAWTVENFCRLSVEKFVGEWIFQGLPASPEQLHEAASRLPDHRVLGATFESLQSGLAVKPERVEWPQDEKSGGPSKKAEPRNRTSRRAKRLKSLELTPKQLQVYTLVHVKGSAIKEVAEQLGKTVQNVHKLLREAENKVSLKPRGNRSVKTQALPTDERGQALIEEDDLEDLE